MLSLLVNLENIGGSAGLIIIAKAVILQLFLTFGQKKKISYNQLIYIVLQQKLN